MDLHLPRPMHGWRALAGEIGIIVVGVLLALIAQQVVETLNWRGEVRQFRAAADSEVSTNLAAIEFRVSQEPCVKQRLAELEAWRSDARAGRPIRPIREIGRPLGYGIEHASWDSRSGDLMQHMPLQMAIAYSGIYGQFDNVSVQLRDEREAWRSLAAFNGTSKLDESDLKKLSELLFRAKSLDRVVQLDWDQISYTGAQMGLRPHFRVDKRFIPKPDPQYCAPLFPRRAF